MTLSELAARFRKLQAEIDAKQWHNNAPPRAVVTHDGVGFAYHAPANLVAQLLLEARDTGTFDDPKAGRLGAYVRSDSSWGGFVPDVLIELGRMTNTTLTGPDPAGKPVARIADALEALAKSASKMELDEAEMMKASWQDLADLFPDIPPQSVRKAMENNRPHLKCGEGYIELPDDGTGKPKCLYRIREAVPVLERLQSKRVAREIIGKKTSHGLPSQKNFAALLQKIRKS